jgi:hypothetical protein
MTDFGTQVWSDNLALMRTFLFSKDARFGPVHQTSAMVDWSEFNRRSTRTLDPQLRVNDREQLRQLQVYMQFAAAAYGWSLFTLSASRTDVLVQSIVHGKTVLANRRILARHCHVDVGKDLVCDKFTSSDFDPGHFVVVCHREAAVVVAIRGTLHLADVASDMMARTVPMPGVTADGAAVHAGILKCAENKLEQLLPVVRDTLAKFPTYKLVVTGHSLGAGTAAVMTVLLNLKRELLPAGTRVQCFAYAVPAVFSYDIATSAELCGNIVSLAACDDCVPRLCLGSMKRLQLDLSDYLIATRKSAFGRLFKAGLNVLRRDWSISTAQETFLHHHIADAALTKLRESIKAHRGDPSDKHVGPDWAVSFPPGSVLWLRTTNRGRFNNGAIGVSADGAAEDDDAAAAATTAAAPDADASAPVAKPKKIAFLQRSDNAEFARLIVSWTMVTDHMPDFYELMLRSTEAALLTRVLRMRVEVLGATGLQRNDDTPTASMHAQCVAQIRGREFPRFNTSIERTDVQEGCAPQWTSVFDWRLESDYLAQFETLRLNVIHIAGGLTGVVQSLQQTRREVIGRAIVPLLPLFPQLARPNLALPDSFVHVKTIDVPLLFSKSRDVSSGAGIASDKVDDDFAMPTSNIEAELTEEDAVVAEDDTRNTGVLHVRITAHFCVSSVGTQHQAVPSSEDEASLNQSLSDVPPPDADDDDE